GFDRRADVKISLMEEGPSAMLSLDAPEIAGHVPFEFFVDLVEIMLEQNVFGRDGRIRLELEPPFAVAPLQPEKGRHGGIDSSVDPAQQRWIEQRRRHAPFVKAWC